MSTAFEVTQALGGKWNGSRGMVRCPCHDDRLPSLSVRDGDERVIVTCFAGCDRGTSSPSFGAGVFWKGFRPKFDRDAFRHQSRIIDPIKLRSLHGRTGRQPKIQLSKLI